MCGISGFIDFSGRSSFDELKAMSDTLSHRGPDDSGYEIFQYRGASIGFGFRRLSIIDLSPAGHQPMQNISNGTWIVFNGEIYNFKEIKVELISLGYVFNSQSDTEVILKSYEEWGLKCVDRFIGMFAIAIFDKKLNQVIFIRDRAGVKPLFYYWKNGILLFASELKAFHKHKSFAKDLDLDALSIFFQQGYIPAPYCIFKDTFKLKPGHSMVLDLNTQSLKEEKYYDLVDAFNMEKLDIPYEDAIQETEKLLVSAFNYRMIADVPIGVFLSGGYDSSCVTALLQKDSTQKIKTYTIGFEDKQYNEAPHAKEVANFLGTDHHEYFCTFKEAMDLVPKLPEICDEPFGDPSIIPTTLVSKIARQNVTVALSADAGDELFAGYPRHLKSLGYINKFNSIPSGVSRTLAHLIPVDSSHLATTNDRKHKLKLALGNTDAVKRFESINQIFTAYECAKLMKIKPKSLDTVFDESYKLNSSNDILSQILLAEYKTYLVDDILQKVDRASMSVSLEAREPFVDHRIAELLARLPSNYKLKDNRQKVLLKDIVHRHLPESIMNRPKMGFGIPLEQWMKKDLKDLFMATMNSDSISMTGVLQPHVIEHMVDAFQSGRLEQFQRIWLVFVFQQWYQHWMS
ncbi:MAG TPA: asparagine synthase (glutamine-hydrolyzing) [Bacteroidia bacterium]|nr:asparagine synthase (glutamine-hydrolyzing) [Bacteroidia bacterium]